MKRRVVIKSLPKAQSGLETKMHNLRAGLGFNANVMPWPIMAGRLSEPDTEVKDTLGPVPREEANLEAEKDEVAMVPNRTGIPSTYKIGGKRHYQGGTPLNLPANSFIFSDTAKMRIKDPVLLAEFGLPARKGGYTPAEIAKKYNINDFKKILADKNTDPLQKQTAELMISNYNLKLAKLALIQEAMKGFPQGIPAIAMPYVESMQLDPAQFMGMNPGEGDDETSESDMMGRYGVQVNYAPGGITDGDPPVNGQSTQDLISEMKAAKAKIDAEAAEKKRIKDLEKLYKQAQNDYNLTNNLIKDRQRAIDLKNAEIERKKAYIKSRPGLVNDPDRFNQELNELENLMYSRDVGKMHIPGLNELEMQMKADQVTLANKQRALDQANRNVSVTDWSKAPGHDEYMRQFNSKLKRAEEAGTKKANVSETYGIDPNLAAKLAGKDVKQVADTTKKVITPPKDKQVKKTANKTYGITFVEEQEYGGEPSKKRRVVIKSLGNYAYGGFLPKADNGLLLSPQGYEAIDVFEDTKGTAQGTSMGKGKGYSKTKEAEIKKYIQDTIGLDAWNNLPENLKTQAYSFMFNHGTNSNVWKGIAQAIDFDKYASGNIDMDEARRSISVADAINKIKSSKIDNKVYSNYVNQVLPMQYQAIADYYDPGKTVNSQEAFKKYGTYTTPELFQQGQEAYRNTWQNRAADIDQLYNRLSTNNVNPNVNVNQPSPNVIPANNTGQNNTVINPPTNNVITNNPPVNNVITTNNANNSSAPIADNTNANNNTNDDEDYYVKGWTKKSDGTYAIQYSNRDGSKVKYGPSQKNPPTEADEEKVRQEIINTKPRKTLTEAEYTELKDLYDKAYKSVGGKPQTRKKTPETEAFQKRYHELLPWMAQKIIASDPDRLTTDKSHYDIKGNEDSIFGRRTIQYAQEMEQLKPTKKEEDKPTTTTTTTEDKKKKPTQVNTPPITERLEGDIQYPPVPPAYNVIDLRNLGNAALNYATTKGFYPYQADPNYRTAQYTFLSPERMAAENQSQMNMFANVLGQNTSPSQLNSRMRDIFGQGFKNAANIIADVQGKNQQISTQQAISDANIANRAEEMKAASRTGLWDKYQTVRQNLKSEREAKKDLVVDYMNKADENMANIYNLNQLHPQFAVDPRGMMYFHDPRQFKPESPKANVADIYANYLADERFANLTSTDAGREILWKMASNDAGLPTSSGSDPFTAYERSKRKGVTPQYTDPAALAYASQYSDI